MRELWFGFLLQFIIIVNHSYSQELDTLFCYNPEEIPAPIVVFEYVSDLGVIFTPDSLWGEYSIESIQILISEAMPNDVEYFYIRSDSLGYPGEIIEEIAITLNDTISSHPCWYNINLTDYSNLNGLMGKFWITGGGLFRGMGNLYSGMCLNTYIHAISYYPCAPCWVGPTANDFSIKVVVKKNSLSVNTNNDRHGEELRYKINVFPNPFNNNTTINIRGELDKRLYVIKIIDMSGREIINTPLTSTTFYWDGLSSKNQYICSGLYLVLLQHNGHILSSQKIIHIK